MNFTLLKQLMTRYGVGTNLTSTLIKKSNRRYYNYFTSFNILKMFMLLKQADSTAKSPHRTRHNSSYAYPSCDSAI